jgi:hypothetical protein
MWFDENPYDENGNFIPKSMRTRMRQQVIEEGQRFASGAGKGNTGRVIARKIAWIEPGGEIIYSGEVRRAPAVAVAA